MDRFLYELAAGLRTEATVGVCRDLSAFASPAFFLVALMVAAVAHSSQDPSTRRWGWDLFRAFLVTLLAAAADYLLKELIHRERPPAAFWCVPETGYSFPSGHATAAAAFWAALALARREMRPLALALAMAIGLSRVVLGVHYPSDVAGGWTLGAAWALALRRKGVTQ